MALSRPTRRSLRTSLISSLAAVVLAAGASQAVAQSSNSDNRYIVSFTPGKSAQAQAAIKQAGGKVVLDLSRHRAMAVELPQRALQALSNNPNVEYVEADAKRYLLAQRQPYGISAVQADTPTIYQPTADGGKTVCVIDSGYDLGHPDLPTNIIGGQNPVNTNVGSGTYWSDENGHGTHVAGTIAAVDNAVGVVGVNSKGILLKIVKVFGASGWAYSSSLIAAHDECEAGGAVITNMSLGGSFKSRTEERAFSTSSLLNIAAAGNDGNTRKSYPASYGSVMSVAAVDENNLVASFSQQNDAVDIAAPGVSVLSTVPRGTGSEASVTVAGNRIEVNAMDGSPNGSATGNLVDCGLGESCSAAGAVCLIERGSISFVEKVEACEDGGGIAAVIYNNEPGPLLGTLGTVVTSIPSVGISDTEGADLLASLGSPAEVVLGPSDYAYFDGTSMATPHVAGVAALVWSQADTFGCSKEDIRTALEVTALDLGDTGRDNAYGHGLVQAKAAIDYLGVDCGAGGGSGGGGGDTGGGGGGTGGDVWITSISNSGKTWTATISRSDGVPFSGTWDPAGEGDACDNVSSCSSSYGKKVSSATFTASDGEVTTVVR